MNKFDYLCEEVTFLMNSVMTHMPEYLKEDYINRRIFLENKNKMEYVENMYYYFVELVELDVEDLSEYYADFRRLRNRFMCVYDESLPDFNSSKLVLEKQQ